MNENQGNTNSEAVNNEPSLEELEAQQAALSRRIDQRKKDERSKVLMEIRQLMDRFDISAQDLATGSKRVRAAAVAKYRNQETGETWTGRGRAPKWLEGRNKEDFLIA